MTSTPAFSEFVRAHRNAKVTLHEQVEAITDVTFDWVGVPAAGIAEGTIGVVAGHRTDARETERHRWLG
jgi:hypothetical protein